MNIYSKVYCGLLLITLVCYLFALQRKELYPKMIVLLMLLWLFVTAAAIYVVRYAGFENNLFLFHILTPIEYSIMAILYRSVIVNKLIKKVLLISIPVFILISILFAIFIQAPDTNNTYVFIIESVALIFLSLFFLREVLLLQQVKDIYTFPMFWISVGILFHFTGILVIEGMLNYTISHSMDLARKVYELGHIFKYLLFISFIIGAFFLKSEPASESLKK